jgi:hypothetical protein
MVPRPPQPMPAGRPSHQVNIVAVRCSVPASSPSSVRKSSRTPGSPVSGSRSATSSGDGTLLHVTQPGRTMTRARPASACASARAGVDTLTCGTVALPPPWVTGVTALGPITAMLRNVAASSGSTPASFLSSVNAVAAQRRSSDGSTSTGPSPDAGCPFGEAPLWSRAPTRRASRRIRSTLALTSPSLTWPSRTAAVSWSPHGPDGPGMARSSPAAAVATVLRAACQSDRATPRNPHSSLRITDSSRACSVMATPLTML